MPHILCFSAISDCIHLCINIILFSEKKQKQIIIILL